MLFFKVGVWDLGAGFRRFEAWVDRDFDLGFRV